MHLAVVIANLGRFCTVGGAVAHADNTCVVIADHRLRPRQRVDFVKEHLDVTDVTSADVTVFTDVTFDCAADIHRWVQTSSTEARCRDCDEVETVPPFPRFDDSKWCDRT